MRGGRHSCRIRSRCCVGLTSSVGFSPGMCSNSFEEGIPTRNPSFVPMCLVVRPVQCIIFCLYFFEKMSLTSSSLSMSQSQYILPQVFVDPFVVVQLCFIMLVMQTFLICLILHKVRNMSRDVQQLHILQRLLYQYLYTFCTKLRNETTHVSGLKRLR